MHHDVLQIDPIDRPAVVAPAIGYTERGLRSLRERGLFPDPVDLGGNVKGWPRSVWQAWLRRRIAGVVE